MRSARHRRLAKVEAAINAAKAVRRPCVLVVDVNRGQSQAEALKGFNAMFPRSSGTGGGLLIVPAKPVTEADHERFAARFKGSQMRLVAEARSRSQELLEDEPPPLNIIIDAVKTPKAEAKRRKSWVPPKQ